MTDRYNRNSPIPMIPSLPIDYLSVALPPTPKARAEAERVNIIIDPAWAPVTGEISRIVNSALWSCEGRPVTHDLVAALVSIIEFRIQDSDAIWASRNIPLAPGFDVVCEPFKRQG